MWVRLPLLMMTGEKGYNMTTFEQAKKRYNKMMNDFCLEHLTIGDRLSENTENWNIRDMVSECQYQLDVCFEDGNSNSEGRYTHELIEYYGYDEEDAKQEHARWLSKTTRLRNFIKKYKEIAMTMDCSDGHCSKFD